MKQVSIRLHKIMIYFHVVCILTIVFSALFMSMAYHGFPDDILSYNEFIEEAYYSTVNWFMYAVVFIMAGWLLSSSIVDLVLKRKGYTWPKKEYVKTTDEVNGS